MADRDAFERMVSRETNPGRRAALVGAWLARSSGAAVVVVGGSAISVYTDGLYVSEDIDVVAPRSRLSGPLRRWGFRFEERGSRGYWVHPRLRLLVDVINRSDYVGRTERLQTVVTPAGPVQIAAVEDLIIRRLIFAKRDRRRASFDQAALLWLRFGPSLDLDYLAYLARYEGVEDLLAALPRSGPGRPSRTRNSRGTRLARPSARRRRRSPPRPGKSV